LGSLLRKSEIRTGDATASASSPRKYEGTTLLGTGENTDPFSLPGARYAATALAPEHSAYGFHLNNVIAKRLGISAGSD
jgi:hypothetical protein